MMVMSVNPKIAALIMEVAWDSRKLACLTIRSNLVLIDFSTRSASSSS
jgi:hypothetical protein